MRILELRKKTTEILIHGREELSVGGECSLFPCFQVLQKLLEKLTGEKFAVPEVTQSEEGQRNKLK